MWPGAVDALIAVQRELAVAAPPAWAAPAEGLRTGGCWACFPRGLTGPGAAGDRVWAAAVTTKGRGGAIVGVAEATGVAGAPYVPGLLALRIGPVLEQAVRRLRPPPDVLLVDATGRDHPRRAGLAVHLGAVLDVPTVGVTHRPLRSTGAWPEDRAGATSPLALEGEVVACWVRTRPGVRPLVVHPGWRVDLQTAVRVVIGSSTRRTPEPLREARRIAREARRQGAAGEGSGS